MTLIGTISEPISRTIDFTIPLTYPKGVSFGCTLNGNQLDCEVDRIIGGNTIIIEETAIKEYNEDVLIIEEFMSEDQVNCANAFIEKAAEKLLVKIAFRQVSHFTKNDQSYSFSFYLIALASEAYQKGKTINMKMDVKIYNEKYEKNATCTLQDDVNPNDEEPVQANFVCSVQLTQTEYINTDFEEVTISVENEEINGVSDIDATVASPLKTDKALEEIKRKKANNETITDLAYVVDYYEEEVKVTPTFTSNNLYIDGCNTTGKFFLSGSFSDDVKSMKIDLVLTYPLTDVKCEFDDAEKNEIINMTCKVHVGFYYVENIFFEQRLIKKKNKEMFIIKMNEFDFDEQISCSDFNTFKINTVKSRQQSKLSFLQLSKFNPQPNILSFFMALARKSTTDSFIITFQLTVKIKISSRRLLRSLDETLSGVKVDCKLNNTLQSDYAAGYDCANNDTITGTPKSMELETSEISGIQGIPENANPEKLTYKIDYSNLENLKAVDSLPSASITSINGSTCFTDGQYIITATLNKNENLETTYYNASLRFSVPESTGHCLLNINGVNVQMICQNQEKFYMSTIYIERQTIQDSEGNELFFIDSYESESEIACDISLISITAPTESNSTAVSTSEQTSVPTSVPEDKTPNSIKYLKNRRSGLSGGAIAGIVIALVFVLAAIITLTILSKKGILFGENKINEDVFQSTTIEAVNVRNN